MAFLTDISLGQYYPGDSFVHRLDPRTKLLSILCFMTALLISFEPIVLIGFSILTLVIIASSQLPLALVLRNVRPFIWLFFLTIFVHVFLTPGRLLYTMPLMSLKITYEGLTLGLIYSVRLVLLILLAALLTLTTSPIELTDALERMLSPLKRFKVPTHEVVMMLTLSLRFIPTLLEEAQRLKNAQVSRGASFEGNVVQRIRSIVPLILPLFISAFRRADDLALAMDSRCYTGGEGRTSFRKLVFKSADYLVLLAVLTSLMLLIIF
ncbi:energy-coupling factor transporter transmembrane protein EcfT [candidate division KSB1 bacterium]|nr:energy-coupling factor transporter transmembrane protein EcfT [candidate division KSB1 bacterium]RQW01655.1 MAG: energy-coupling factor transporter transmembrane protein EcfT [candidate division KSB1 bacterium]